MHAKTLLHCLKRKKDKLLKRALLFFFYFSLLHTPSNSTRINPQSPHRTLICYAQITRLN
ncbi:uncharacterized protein ASPGLDRAFT_1250105 [Aspergillus glaucus CBS 516.65]|uniref:Uncharacterized protein n=1 Tax=Aspergillus glaucus CBS 516.65 TaxID=1160497 RepID=A0A1L9VRP8_ASPGL|nr:hypothetical protein ASPGLDRAFT_1250105 [Aspergillus glaucus CBS 516.65]OJJ86608.1 hypothetical protein ASPGLDRAFT_1250105 [Aspergillus glaucus CBS 516.65]